MTTAQVNTEGYRGVMIDFVFHVKQLNCNPSVLTNQLFIVLTQVQIHNWVMSSWSIRMFHSNIPLRENVLALDLERSEGTFPRSNRPVNVCLLEYSTDPIWMFWPFRLLRRSLPSWQTKPIVMADSFTWKCQDLTPASSMKGLFLGRWLTQDSALLSATAQRMHIVTKDVVRVLSLGRFRIRIKSRPQTFPILPVHRCCVDHVNTLTESKKWRPQATWDGTRDLFASLGPILTKCWQSRPFRT